MERLTDVQLDIIHARSSLNKPELALHDAASCFYCIRVFWDGAVEWTDCGMTPLCPYCGVDAVLPGEYPEPVLEQLNEKYFTPKE